LCVLAQHHQAAGEIDLGGRLPGQELGRPFERLARLDEAAKLETRLTEDVKRLPGIGSGFGDLRQERLRPGKVTGGSALHGVARQRLDLEVGKRHERPLAEAAAKKKLLVGAAECSRPPERLFRFETQLAAAETEVANGAAVKGSNLSATASTSAPLGKNRAQDGGNVMQAPDHGAM
jgi:hypothetical protein